MYVIRPLAIASLLLAGASWARAQSIIYQDDFSGASSTPLHGQSPVIENSGLGSTWVTRTDTGLPLGTGVKFTAAGDITLTPADSGAATLGFAPVAGNVYTLSASFGAIQSTENPENWVGLGFASGQATGPGPGAEFFGNNTSTQTTGQPWMFFRGSSATGNFANGTLLGPGIAEGVQDWTTPVVSNFGDPVDLRIVLDTTTPLWSVEWQAKNPADANFTTVGAASYTTNPNIGAVGFVAIPGVSGSIDSFSLATSGSVFASGDTNGNGVADLVDYNTIRNNFFEPLLGPSNGDLNNDGVVDYVDFRVWKNSATPAALAAIGAPEPASALLGAMGLVLLAPLALRRRRSGFLA